jgi:hypothetical protein
VKPKAAKFQHEYGAGYNDIEKHDAAPDAG